MAESCDKNSKFTMDFSGIKLIEEHFSVSTNTKTRSLEIILSAIWSAVQSTH